MKTLLCCDHHIFEMQKTIAFSRDGHVDALLEPFCIIATTYLEKLKSYS